MKYSVSSQHELPAKRASLIERSSVAIALGENKFDEMGTVEKVRHGLDRKGKKTGGLHHAPVMGVSQSIEKGQTVASLPLIFNSRRITVQARKKRNETRPDAGQKRRDEKCQAGKQEQEKKEDGKNGMAG